MQKVFLMLFALGFRMKTAVLLFLAMALLALTPAAFAEPVQVKLSERTTLILPLQIVRGTQLYSLKDGKGYPAVETVLATWKKRVPQGEWYKEEKRVIAQLTFGAAAEIGTSINVPFVGLQFRLPSKFFDTSDNDIMFGPWIGRTSGRVDGKRRTRWGLQASIPLW